MISNLQKIVALVVILVVIYMLQSTYGKEYFDLSIDDTFNYDTTHTKWSTNKKKGTLTLYTNSLPYHSYGKIGLKTVPKSISLTYTLYYRTSTDSAAINPTSTTGADGVVGYALNGIRIMGPGTGGCPSTSGSVGSKTQWPSVSINGETLTYSAAYYLDSIADISIGQDLAGGHPDSSGIYHYHDFSFLDVWGTGDGNASNNSSTKIGAELSLIPYYNGSATHDDGHSKILGFAFDGYPIYGPYGYKSAKKSGSGVKTMSTGYTLKKDYRNGTIYGTEDIDWFYIDGVKTDITLGVFLEDWEYTGAGDLDEHNGRECVTPDYPNGIYAYFACVDSSGVTTYPHFVGTTFYGDVYDSSSYPKGSA